MRAWTVGYVLLVAAAGVGAFLGGFAVNNALSEFQTVPVPAVLVATLTLGLGAIPGAARLPPLRTRLSVTGAWCAVILPAAVLVFYGAVLWFFVRLGATDVDDKRLSVLLMPLIILAPLGAVTGNAVVAATPIRRASVAWALMAGWAALLTTVAVVAITVRVRIWY